MDMPHELKATIDKFNTCQCISNMELNSSIEALTMLLNYLEQLGDKFSLAIKEIRDYRYQFQTIKDHREQALDYREWSNKMGWSGKNIWGKKI